MDKMREPMLAKVAFSAEQLEDLGVPESMTESELSECLDRAMLDDPSVLRRVIWEYVEEEEVR